MGAMLLSGIILGASITALCFFLFLWRMHRKILRRGDVEELFVKFKTDLMAELQQSYPKELYGKS